MIETEPQPTCPLCGDAGEELFHGLQDRMFDAPGVWTMKACPSCGAGWLDPRPTRESIGEAYKTYYTHAPTRGLAALYDGTVRRIARERAAAVYGFGRATPVLAPLCELLVAMYPALADQTDLLIRHLSAGPGGTTGRLVDIGCGHGEALEFLAGIGWDSVGVEIDARAVEAARQRGLDVIQGDIHSAAFDSDAFDAVTSSHVIEHLHDPLEFLVEAHRILKPGGSVVAVTPNIRTDLLKRHGASWLELDPPRHLILFNADNLANLARQAGFRDVHVKRTARLAGFDHIASLAIAAHGRYQIGLRPDLSTWLASKRLEAQLKNGLKDGGEGKELVLMARK